MKLKELEYALQHVNEYVIAEEDYFSAFSGLKSYFEKAKKKPLESLSLEDLGISLDDQRIRYSNFRLPPEKPAGKQFEATDDSVQSEVVTNVVNLLKTEAKVL